MGSTSSVQYTIPLVSICMPAYNAGKYIMEAVSSIIRQSYSNWELIIVNDGSDDDTPKLLNTITDSRIQIYHQSNAGQCIAANKAFSYAKGDLIKFMDADDLISENFIESQVQSINGNYDIIASASWGRFYNDNLNTFVLNPDTVKESLSPIEWLVKAMTEHQVMLQCALWLIPRPILLQAGLWNEELSLINDFEFFIRILLKAQRIVCAEDAVLYYRSGLANSLSGLKSSRGALSAYKSVDWGTQHMLNYENSDRIKQLTANHFQHLIYSLYPDHTELVAKAEQKIKVMGGSTVPFPAGGYTQVLSNIIGWKFTQRLKKMLF